LTSTTDASGRDAASVASRPWWIDAPGASLRITPAYEPTCDETSLAERLERQIALGHFRIPQIPAVAARAVALLVKPDVDPTEVSKLIHEDQQLAADVIAFSNSSLFAGATKTTNIPQAIGRVGFRRTRNLIFAASLKAAIYHGGEVARAEMLWRHACGCGAVASQIARNLRANADDLYLAGLFHDVGKTVVLSLLDTIALRSGQTPLRSDFVDLVLTVHHERVGGEVVKRWGLPDQVDEVVQRHSEGGDAPLSRAQAIVALANNACHRLGVGAYDDGRRMAGEQILQACGAAPADLAWILDGVLAAAGVA
jgi:putative nucleotidyltransferase with HDIG domain